MNINSFRYFLVIVFVFIGSVCSITITYEVKNERCNLLGGQFIHDNESKDSEYACFVPYTYGNDNSYTSENSVCFYGNHKALCIDRNNTSYEECDMTSKSYNFNHCISNFFELSKRINFKWDTNLESYPYPYKKKITFDKELDKDECSQYHKGTILEDKDGNYVCLYRHYRMIMPNTYCVEVDDKSDPKGLYCILDYLTTIDVCNVNSDKSTYGKCFNELLKISSGKLSNINRLNIKNYKD